MSRFVESKNIRPALIVIKGGDTRPQFKEVDLDIRHLFFGEPPVVKKKRYRARPPYLKLIDTEEALGESS